LGLAKPNLSGLSPAPRVQPGVAHGDLIDGELVSGEQQ
jgi:hypothetical protein